MKISEGHIAITALIAFSGWLFVGLPWFYSPLERIQYYETAQNAPHGTTAQPQGTAQAPFFVQVIPGPKSAKERTDEAEDREEKRSGDRWLVRWTAALFAATVGLILATGVLGYFAFRQARDMKASIAAAQAAVDAALEANSLNRASFVTTQRPWISVNAEVDGPLEYDVNGLNVTARFLITNTGNSPAIHVCLYPQIVAPAPGVDTKFDVRGIIQEAITARKIAPLSPWGSTVFPGHPIIEQYKIVSISNDELKRITQKIEAIYPVLIVIAEYRFIFESAPHYTAFALDIRRSGVHSNSAVKKRAAGVIWLDEGNIPADEIIFTKSFIGGEYAD